MRITFTKKGHIYRVNGNIAEISVTELLNKHHLSPDYSCVNEEDLKASADEGTRVHKDLENILNKANYEPTTEQGKNFAKWVKENLDCGVGEQKLAYVTDNFILAGTADVMGFLKDGTAIIADHKNTSVFHREYVEWQTSLLDYMARKLGNEQVNGKVLNWKGAKTRYCFHYNKKTGELSVKTLGVIPDEEIEKLLNCELNGEIYQRPVLVIENELMQKFEEAERALIEIETTYKQAQDRAKELRKELLNLFEKQNIKSWETPDRLLKVTYIPQIDKLQVDSALLKKTFPQAYYKCIKVVKNKPTIRITRREDEL